MIDDPDEYCMLMCRRIAYYLATYHQIELLRIRAEFMVDDDKKLWFTGASRISIRNIKIDDEMFSLMFNRV